jgi:hypothetical protein
LQNVFAQTVAARQCHIKQNENMYVTPEPELRATAVACGTSHLAEGAA